MRRLGWLGWLGLGGFLYFRRHVVRRTAILWTLLFSTAALAMAFHWAPAAMAYTINDDLPLGTLVMLPILLFEAARLAIPFLLVRGGPPPNEAPPGESDSDSPAGGVPVLPRWVWLAVLADTGATVAVTLNGLRLLRPPEAGTPTASSSEAGLHPPRPARRSDAEPR